jgi:hypothetical protein
MRSLNCSLFARLAALELVEPESRRRCSRSKWCPSSSAPTPPTPGRVARNVAQRNSPGLPAQTSEQAGNSPLSRCEDAGGCAGTRLCVHGSERRVSGAVRGLWGRPSRGVGRGVSGRLDRLELGDKPIRFAFLPGGPPATQHSRPEADVEFPLKLDGVLEAEQLQLLRKGSGEP